MTETEIIGRLKAGDERAFERVYDTHKRRIYSLCLRMTRCVPDAEDLTQEVFIQLLRKISTFRGESAFSTWLHRVAVNVVLMHLRQRSNEVSFIDCGAQTEDEDRVWDLPTLDRTLGACVERIQIERAIESLPSGYRIVFILHDIEGYEHNEIAAMLGFTIHTSKSQLHRARLRIRDFILTAQQHARRESHRSVRARHALEPASEAALLAPQLS